MRHLLILISLLSTLSFIGCRDESDAIYLIDRAESLLKSDPDSSHILLDSIAVPDNLSDKLLARWCMLSGKVADTLYTDLPYVQQLLRAQAYYKSHGTKQEQAKIGLYLGRSYVEDKENENESADEKCDAELTNLLMHLKKGDSLTADTYEIKEGETSPPKRYTSGSIILTMENAGQFIEDEELRAQIKGSGIGTSATRAEILKKLVNIEYLALNKKTQVLTPTQMGEMIYDVVSDSIRPLLNPALTASWEKGLTMVADGVITPEEYMGKLTDFVGRRTTAVRSLNNQGVLWRQFQATEEFYQKKTKQSNAKNKE